MISTLLIPQLAFQIPTKIPQPTVRYIEFIKPVEQPRFPDRTKEAAEAIAYRAEQARLAAVEAARVAEEARVAAEAAQQAQAAYTPPPPVSVPSDGYKAFIYMHESGNDPQRWNTSGCVGLGQACPASKLLAVCPLLDYGCEDAWFTNYMQGRYGSWQAAYNWWIRTDCRPYCGHWW